MNDTRALRPTLGELIAARRKTLNLTQKELAALAHTSERTIRSYETGKLPDPKSHRLLEYALHWTSDAISEALDGWVPETIEESSGGILWSRLPIEFREPRADSAAAWKEAWRKKNAYLEEYEAAALAKHEERMRTSKSYRVRMST